MPKSIKPYNPRPVARRRQVRLRTRKQRAQWYASGRITLGKISTLHQSKRNFLDWHVGKIRGRIVPNPKTDIWKHTTREDARAAAEAFLEMCRKESNDGTHAPATKKP